MYVKIERDSEYPSAFNLVVQGMSGGFTMLLTLPDGDVPQQVLGEVDGQTFYTRSEDGGSAHLQYKGFDVCADIRCECGEQYHVDAEFAYFVKCSACGATYRMPGAMQFDKIERVAGESPEWATIIMRDEDGEEG